MSGVMALLSLDGRPLSEERAHAMATAIAHRGDGDPRLWLGQAATAGIALGQAHRPTTPEAEREVLPGSSRHGQDPGRFWIAWDGRIDNRDELARRLGVESAEAHDWTDADYVLGAYARWGSDCAPQLLGDWAIVIWDGLHRRLFCATDPSGSRQLYYREASGMLAVGSEPLQLFAGDGVPAIHHEYALRFLAQAYLDPAETEYAGVRNLPGGTALTVECGRLATHTFWRYPRITPRRYRRPEEYVDEFADTLARATAARLRSNRPLGVFLSGGLDSSYVAAVAAQQGANLVAISSYAPGTAWDERGYQLQVVEHTGIAYRAVDISDCWALTQRYLPVETFDSIHHPGQSAMVVRLGRAAADEGVGVTLGGDGADAWMGGASTYIADAVVRARPGEALRLARLAAGARSASTPRTLARHAAAGLLPPAWVRAVRRARGHDRLPDARPAIVEPARLRAPHLPDAGTAWSPRAVRRREWDAWRWQGPQHAPWRERHALSPYGVEHRAPFHDLRVVELMASTPDWVKRFRGRTKDVLREAEYRVLPRAIPDRRDKAPYDELWLRGVHDRERQRVADALDAVTRLPGVRADAAREEVERYLDAAHAGTRPAWRLVSAGLWLQFVDTLRSVRSSSNAVETGRVGSPAPAPKEGIS